MAAYITEFAGELGDQAPLKSSITRAVHLYQQSGRSLASFLDRLYQARATVRERTTTPTAKPITNRMSYFYRVLEDDLGLTPAEHTPEPSATNAADKMTRPTPPHTDTLIEAAGGG